MNWQAFSASVVARFSSKPQNSALAEMACRQIEQGLQALAALGLPFHLVPGHLSSAEWPKTMFHATSPDGVLIYGPTQASELGEGWFDSLAAAREWAGRRAQFIGRGGQRLPGLPMVIPGGRELTNVERGLPPARASRDELVAQAKARGL